MKRILCLLTAIFLFALPSCSSPAPSDALTIDVLEVGKADCIIIRQGGHVVMIDTGEEENAPEILHFLKQNSIHTVDTLILSHFDKDHIGGANEILRQIEVKNVIESTFSSDREEYGLYHKTLENSDTKLSRINENLSFTLGECHFTVDSPKKESYDKKQDNNASLIVLMKYRENTFGFFGDALEERLREYTESYSEELLFAKLPHHGSHHKEYENFLTSIAPRYAAITCSEKNRADEKTLELLEEKKIAYYQTKDGGIKLTFDGKSVQITQ